MPKENLIYCNLNKALVGEEICAKCEESCLDEKGRERLK